MIQVRPRHLRWTTIGQTVKPVFAVLALAALVIGGVVSRADAAPACADDRVQLRWPGGEAEFRVELAVDEVSRRRGLMYRDALPRFGGMLFVYPAPHRARFWMENTRIPLDMLFFDAGGTLKSLHRSAEPFSRKSIDGGDGVQFVLEINGGLSDILGIVTGGELRHPMIPQETADWPCK